MEIEPKLFKGLFKNNTKVSIVINNWSVNSK